jgi:hypothetical protein
MTTPIERIQLLHVADHLRSLRPSLGSEIQAYQQLPETQRGNLETHAAYLHQYLEANNKPLPEQTLLELVCFTPGLIRGLPQPLDCLQENRGGFSPRRLREATRRLEVVSGIVTFYQSLPLSLKEGLVNLARAINFTTVSLNSSLAIDNLALLQQLIPQLPGDIPSRLVAEYSDLSTASGRKLAGWAVGIFDDHTKASLCDIAHDVVIHLACFVEGALSGYHIAMIDSEHSYPGIVFREAERKARRRILSLIRSDVSNINQLLIWLAWIGDKGAQKQFLSWRKRPPRWRSSLNVAPEVYTRQAGWELTPDGKRRDLYYSKCYPLARTTDNDITDPQPIEIAEESSSKCEWCSRTLTVLLDLDLSHQPFSFLGTSGTRLRVSTCDVCTCYGTIFTEVDWDGCSEWSAQNQKPQYLPGDSEKWERLPSHRLVLSKSERGVYNAADWRIPIFRSQIGGYPTWIQDAEYPKCPVCSRCMRFIAQVAREDLEEYGEGVYYVFLCQSCKVAATSYQQT